MVGVVAHQRRHVERRREAGLPVLEQVAEALVRLLRRPEAGELAHRPEPAAVHRRVDAARERIRAGPAEVALVVELDVLGRVERLVLDAGDRREELALTLRRRLVALAPLAGAAGLLLAVRRRHPGPSLEGCYSGRRRQVLRSGVSARPDGMTVLLPAARVSPACGVPRGRSGLRPGEEGDAVEADGFLTRSA